MSSKVLYCHSCQKDAEHKVKSVSHLMHWILIFLTGGLWLAVYLVALFIHRPDPKCIICGTNKFSMGLSGYLAFAVIVLYFSFQWGVSQTLADYTGFVIPYELGQTITDWKMKIEAMGFGSNS
jgi:hypothetical protein